MNRLYGSAPDSNASGSAFSSAVASMMPTDRLTMRSTTFDSIVKEKTAASTMLSVPEIAVASRMNVSAEEMAGSFLQQSCKLKHGNAD